MSDPRQTQSYLRSLFARRGIAPQHRYGQNFLIDLNIHELIVKTAEVGPGRRGARGRAGGGALTALMAARGAAVVAVEIDPAMAALTAEAVGRHAERPGAQRRRPGGQDRSSTPRCSTTSAPGWPSRPERRLKLVANLPYNIATPIVEQPARPSRALPEPDGGHDPARAGRADARRAEQPKPTAPSRSWSRPWPTVDDRADPAADASSGRGPRSTRPSS